MFLNAAEVLTFHVTIFLKIKSYQHSSILVYQTSSFWFNFAPQNNKTEMVTKKSLCCSARIENLAVLEG